MHIRQSEVNIKGKMRKINKLLNKKLSMKGKLKSAKRATVIISSSQSLFK